MSKIYSVSIFKILALLVMVISIASCETIIDSISDLPEEVPVGNNPNDPDNPNFTMPEIVLIGYPDPVNFTVTENFIELSWESSTEIQDILYKYKLAAPGQLLEEVNYIDIEPGMTSIQLEVMETFGNENYQFEIVAQFSGSPDKTTSLTGSFNVDANHEKAFIFRQNVIQMSNEGNFVVPIYLDEISEADNLTALSLVLNFSSFDVSIIGVQIYNDERSFLYRSGAQIISFHDIMDNQIVIDAGVAGANLPPLSGGGVIGEIVFAPNYFFDNTSITISGASVLKASDGSDIGISENNDVVILTQ